MLQFEASVRTRRGDWVMRMRFWGVNTRETEGISTLIDCRRAPLPPKHEPWAASV